jgi:GNAT superfamily N-acetyltransferase
MARLEFTLRRASGHELPELASIDDEACSLYAAVGLSFDFSPSHPFARAEYARWGAAIGAGLVQVAVSGAGELLGFAVMSWVGGAPHLEQLSVRPRAMRQGIGSALVAQAVLWSGECPLWLTTYEHVAWNAPFYRRFGFGVVPEAECSAEIREILREQRVVLPAPERRVAMVRPPGALRRQPHP